MLLYATQIPTFVVYMFVENTSNLIFSFKESSSERTIRRSSLHSYENRKLNVARNVPVVFPSVNNRLYLVISIYITLFEQIKLLLVQIMFVLTVSTNLLAFFIISS